MKTVKIETNLGDFCASFTEQGLAQLEFPSEKVARQKNKSPSNEEDSKVTEWKCLTQKALESVLKGKQPNKLPPFDLTEGTEFQRSVWAALTSIPIGRTKGYAEVAQAIGRPKATRAVGQACGANPIPVLIPCHRVLAANRKLGGFSSGLSWKKRLLAIEGVEWD